MSMELKMYTTKQKTKQGRSVKSRESSRSQSSFVGKSLRLGLVNFKPIPSAEFLKGGFWQALTSLDSFLNPIDRPTIMTCPGISVLTIQSPVSSYTDHTVPLPSSEHPQFTAHLTTAPPVLTSSTDSGNPTWLNIDRTSHIWNPNLQIAAQPPDSPSADQPTLTTTKPSSIKLSLSHFSYHPTNTRHTNHPAPPRHKRKDREGETQRGGRLK